MQLALSTYQNRGNFYLSSKKSISYSCSSLELSNHLGNVLSVISDKVIPHASGGSVAYYKADILQAMDYSPFGVKLKGRNLNKTGNTELYRSGFQGQEEDDELKGDGNSINYSFRMHDPRVGRFFAIDPLFSAYPRNSPYAFSENRVIDAVELEGQEKQGFEQTKSEILKRMGTGTVITKTDQNEVKENIKLRGYMLHSELVFFVKDPSKAMMTDNIPVPKGGASFIVRQDNYEKAQKEGEQRAADGKPAVTDDAPGSYRVIVGNSNLLGLVEEYPPITPPEEPKDPIIDGVPLPEKETIDFNIDAQFGNWKSVILNKNEIASDLDNLAEALKKDNTLSVIVAGVGLGAKNDTSPYDASYTAVESNNDRANSVRQELINRGVNSSQISIGASINNAKERTVKVTVTNN